MFYERAMHKVHSWYSVNAQYFVTGKAAAPPVSMEKCNCQTCSNTKQDSSNSPVPVGRIPAAVGASWDVQCPQADKGQRRL